MTAAAVRRRHVLRLGATVAAAWADAAFPAAAQEGGAPRPAAPAAPPAAAASPPAAAAPPALGATAQAGPAPAAPRPRPRPRPRRRPASPPVEERFDTVAPAARPATPPRIAGDPAPIPNRELEGPRAPPRPDRPSIEPDIIDRRLPSRGQAAEGSVSRTEDRLFQPAPGARMVVPFSY